jgi:Cytochrome C assembly protein
MGHNDRFDLHGRSSPVSLRESKESTNGGLIASKENRQMRLILRLVLAILVIVWLFFPVPRPSDWLVRCLVPAINLGHATEWGLQEASVPKDVSILDVSPGVPRRLVSAPTRRHSPPWAAITWLVYPGYLHMRITRGWRGRRAAYFAILGFAVVMFTFFGVTYLLPGLHAYA